MTSVHKFLLEQNKEYYERMVEAFPEEPIWKQALTDTNNLLRMECA